MTGLYLYQTVHLARGRARNVARHIAVLDAASRELFGRPYAPTAERLAKRIETLSAAERYPAGVSGFVRIELDPDGTERLLPAGVSLYDGYAFRSLQPEAVTVGYDLTLSEAPTSAREAAAQLARWPNGAGPKSPCAATAREFSARPTTRRCWPSPAAPS